MANPPIEFERQAIEAHLAAQLDDAATGRMLADFVVSDVLQWKPPLMAASEVNSIVAYTFGNRIDANGNRTPGPVNEALADLVVQLHNETRAPVFAQWEVAAAIGNRVAATSLVSITPQRNAHAEPVYLSTGGVAEAIVKLAGHANALGKVAIVGFSDHIHRCITTSQRAGMQAAAPAGYNMPGVYDASSGQPWTRARLIYLLHDLHCRALDHRDGLLSAAQGNS